MLVRYLERRVAELSRLLADRQELLAAGQGWRGRVRGACCGGRWHSPARC